MDNEDINKEKNAPEVPESENNESGWEEVSPQEPEIPVIIPESEDVPKGDDNGEAPESSGKTSHAVYDWLQTIVAALIAVVLVFVFVGRNINVSGASMNPTLYNRDALLVSNLFYTPKAGDIVIITKESFSSSPIVKRVIATEGQQVDIDFTTGTVYVDGEALDEPYIAQPTYTAEGTEFPLTVPEGCIFVMGDNRNNSTDSRDDRIGCVDTRCVIGKVYMILVPSEGGFSRFGSVYKNN